MCAVEEQNLETCFSNDFCDIAAPQANSNQA